MISILVVFLLIIIFLAFFIGKNLSNVCAFWFFKTYTDLPVSVLVFIAFAAGIVFSLILISFGKILKKKNETESISEKEEKEKTVEKKRFKISRESLARKSNRNKEENSSDNTEKITDN